MQIENRMVASRREGRKEWGRGVQWAPGLSKVRGPGDGWWLWRRNSANTPGAPERDT